MGVFFDLKNGHAKLIILLLESKNGHAKWHDYFFDSKNSHAELIIPLFGSKNGYAKRHIWYLCRGVLHTPPQCILKRNV